MVDNVWDDFFKKIPDTDPDQYSFDFNDNMATSTSVPKIDLTDSNITWTSNTFSGNITYPYTIPNTGSTNLNWQPLLTVGTTTTSHPFQVNGNSVVVVIGLIFAGATGGMSVNFISFGLIGSNFVINSSFLPVSVCLLPLQFLMI